MTMPKYQNYRVCYTAPKGNPLRKMHYELYKYCDCPDCYDKSLKRLPVEEAIAYTDDISKVDEVAEFLKGWTCKDKIAENARKKSFEPTRTYFDF